MNPTETWIPVDVHAAARAEDLTRAHVGIRIRVRMGEEAVTGEVRSVEHGAGDAVDLDLPGRPPDHSLRVYGAPYTRVALGPWGIVLELPASSYVELIGGR